MNNKTLVHIGTLYARHGYIDNLIQSFEGLKQATGYISTNAIETPLKIAINYRRLNIGKAKVILNILLNYFQLKQWNNG